LIDSDESRSASAADVAIFRKAYDVKWGEASIAQQAFVAQARTAS